VKLFPRQWISIIVRYFIGPDVFISYARSDAYVYAGVLSAKLSSLGLRPYIDQNGTQPGRQVPKNVISAVSQSSVLVVLISPAAFQSPSLEAEVSAFPHSKRPVIPVIFNATAATSGVVSHPPFLKIIEGMAIAPESIDNLHLGSPTAILIERIINAVGNHRQNYRLKMAGIGTAAFLLVGFVLLVAVLQNLKTVDNELSSKTDKLAKKTIELSDINNRLSLAKIELGNLANQVKDQKAIAKREKKRAELQRTTTAEVWDALQEGIQLSYIQPDVSCKDGHLDLKPPISIYMHADKIDFTDAARNLLDAFVSCYLKQDMLPLLEIVGHSSEITRREKYVDAVLIDDGVDRYSKAYAQKKSERMATSVSRYLSSVGLPISKMVTSGYGIEANQYPISLMNNRVEIKIRNTSN